MKRILLVAAAAGAISTPALAADGAPYVGVEAGVFIPQKSDVDRKFNSGGGWVDFLDVKHDLGYDADLIAGYDFGMFRIEGELGRKHAGHSSSEIDPHAPGPFPGGGTQAVVPGATIDANGRTNVTSGMINALIDLGNEEGLNFYAGGGVGIARVSQTIETLGTATNYHLKDHDKLAWQIIAGARMPISDNMDVGLKYRYFAAGTLMKELRAGQPGDRRPQALDQIDAPCPLQMLEQAIER